MFAVQGSRGYKEKGLSEHPRLDVFRDGRIELWHFDVILMGVVPKGIQGRKYSR